MTTKLSRDAVQFLARLYAAYTDMPKPKSIRRVALLRGDTPPIAIIELKTARLIAARQRDCYMLTALGLLVAEHVSRLG